MPKAVFVVFTRPVDPSREAEYNDWYTNVHVPEVTQVPGIVSARRLTLSKAQQRELDPAPKEYLALYEFDSDDLEGVLAEMQSRVANGTIHMTDAIEVNPPPVTYLYEELPG
jgi:hypothetical protein